MSFAKKYAALVRKSALSLSLVTFLLVGQQPSAAAAPGDDLIGVWTAKRLYGPLARGPIVLEKGASGWTVDFVGHTLPARVEGSQLKFTLPNGEGSFSSPVPQGNRSFVGHWTPPYTRVDRVPYAYAVQLNPERPNRWRGQVQPRDDTFTFYLSVSRRPDGTLGAFLRNPERNVGVQFDLDRLVLEGSAVKLFGKASGKGPETVLISGTYDAPNKALSLRIPWTGDDVYQFTRDDEGLSGFYARGKKPERYTYRAPLALDDGWPTGTLDEAQISRAGIEKFIQMLLEMPIDSVHSPQVEVVLVARHGKLVLEEYFHGFHRDMLHSTRSAAKSLTAVLVGAAMQAGAPLELSSPVYQLMNAGAFPPNIEPRKRDMTLEHLLMMRSGIACDDSIPSSPGQEDVVMAKSYARTVSDVYHYYMGLPLDRVPGQTSVYCSLDPNLALGMVSRATGESQLDTFDRLIGAPLKITQYAWTLDGSGNPYGGGSTQLLPRDFLKLGQLMLNGGTWNGQRILSRDFVERASAPLHDLKRIQYGYLWWSFDFPYKNRTARGFFAGGNGGQGVFVFPALDLVIGIFAGNYADSVGLHVQQDLPTNYILPAVREPGDDPNAPVIEGTFKTNYGLPGVPNPR